MYCGSTTEISELKKDMIQLIHCLKFLEGLGNGSILE
jgi:hypothetical protein